METPTTDHVTVVKRLEVEHILMQRVATDVRVALADLDFPTARRAARRLETLVRSHERHAAAELYSWLRRQPDASGLVDRALAELRLADMGLGAATWDRWQMVTQALDLIDEHIAFAEHETFPRVRGNRSTATPGSDGEPAAGEASAGEPSPDVDAAPAP